MNEFPQGCTARQISGQDENGDPVLSVIAKITYGIAPDGSCFRHAETIPLQDDLAYYDDSKEEILAADLDLYAYKKKTDIIVKGNAQLRKPTRKLTAEVYLGKTRKSITVSGNRKATLGQSGKVIFSEPDYFEKIPLRYDYAYGGWDKTGEYALEIHDPAEAAEYERAGIDWQAGSPYKYPRNPAGKGYLVDLSTIDDTATDLKELGQRLLGRFIPSRTRQSRIAQLRRPRRVTVPDPHRGGRQILLGKNAGTGLYRLDEPDVVSAAHLFRTADPDRATEQHLHGKPKRSV